MGKCNCFRLHNDAYVSGEMARLFSVLQQLHKNPHTGKRTVLKYTCSSCSQVNLKCDIFLNTLYYFYHPLTKLWEGNIFGRVCLSFCPRREGSCVTIIHDAVDLTVQGPGHDTVQGLSLLLVVSCGQDWRSDETCSLEDPSSTWC